MQPIERYGLVALLFLVVTVVAVVLWDKKSDKDKLANNAPETTLLQPQPGAPELGGSAALGAPTQPQPTAPVATTPDVLQPAPSTPLQVAQAPLQPLVGSEPTLVPEAQPAFTTPASAPASGSHYKVKRGDTLSSIAKATLGAANRYPEIIALNPGLDPNRMKVGQELALPGAARTPAASAPKSAPAVAKSATPAAAGTTYTVRRGDSLWTIAEAQLGDGDRYTELATLNPQIDPKRLVVGAKLRLPATSARPARSEARPAVAANTSRRGGVL